MRVESLTSFEAEHVLARIMGYHVRSPRPDQSFPTYVLIDDWNKEGTVVNGCRFQPCTDRAQWKHLANVFHVKTASNESGGWDAGILTDGIKLVRYSNALTEGEAIVRCLVKMVYPDQVLDAMLHDNPL